MDAKTFLVVDDSATMRQLITLTLRKMKGCEIVEVANGAEAVAHLSSHPVDLVITDIKMPEMDGLQLIAHIRGVLKSTVSIIVVTTKGEEKDRDECLKAGANAYLPKPMSGASLLQLIGKLLGTGSALPVN